jgi:hypothetical protein
LHAASNYLGKSRSWWSDIANSMQNR